MRRVKITLQSRTQVASCAAAPQLGAERRHDAGVMRWVARPVVLPRLPLLPRALFIYRHEWGLM